MERDPAGAGAVLWLLRVSWNKAQNKAASCLKLEFPQPRGRPKSPAPVPSVPRPRSPRPSSLGTQESGPQHLCLWAGLLSQPRRGRAGWGGGPRPPEALGVGSPCGPPPALARPPLPTSRTPPSRRMEEPRQELCVYSRGHGWGGSGAWAGLGLGSGRGSGSGLTSSGFGLTSSGFSSQGKVGRPRICSR